MQIALIINAHHPYPFSEGKLNAELVKRIEKNLYAKGFEIEHTATSEDYDIEKELGKHRWADLIIIQAPLNWFSVPWPIKSIWTMSTLLAWMALFVTLTEECRKSQKRIMAQGEP
jgi:putative NADPH-quinone reductase